MNEKIPDGLTYCRKCTRLLPDKNFYDCADMGFIDTNMRFSVCKECINKIYDELFQKNNSLEKTIHKMCTSLNIKYSNDAASAAKLHIQTLLGNGKKVNSIFGIYKQKLVSVQKTMDKQGMEDQTYEDVGTIFTEKQIDTTNIPIPEEVRNFWGKDLLREDIEFLENEFMQFKQTHKADTRAEVVLLKQVCYTLLDIKNVRKAGNSTDKLVKELQDLMKNLAISPNAINAASADKGLETFGLWIQDIESQEPAQWLSTDPRGDLYRDVGNVEEYFQKYFVRPLKNFITGSKDFNVEEGDKDEDEFALTDDETAKFEGIDDGEVVE